MKATFTHPYRQGYPACLCHGASEVAHILRVNPARNPVHKYTEQQNSILRNAKRLKHKGGGEL